MLTVIGQWEREAIGERTSAAMQHKASQGEYTVGAAPYGYALAADGVALVEAAAEQAVIAEARALRGTGLSLRKIVEALDRKGFRARNGRTFAPVQVARINPSDRHLASARELPGVVYRASSPPLPHWP